jgi:aryl-alcohol dehydrogenase-like predicted oxidoreductase
MRTMLLGQSGVEVSALCFGTANIGSAYDDALSFELMDIYTAAGGAFLDTANMYACWHEPGGQGGESEACIGRYLAARGNRDDLFIASKVGFEYADIERSLSRAVILDECDKSLTRLGTDHIDLYYAHVDDPNTPLDETLAAYDELTRSGKVRFIGASNYPSWRVEEAHWVSSTQGLTGYCCVQQRLSYLRPVAGADFAPQRASTDELRHCCDRRGLTLLAYSPLLGGVYARTDKQLGAEYVGPDAEARLAALGNLAQQLGVTANQLVFAWMWHQSPPIIPITAISKPQQLHENLAALDIQLSDEQVKMLDTAGNPGA